MLGSTRVLFSHVVSIEALMIAVGDDFFSDLLVHLDYFLYVLNLLSCALSMSKKTCRKPGDFFSTPKPIQV